MFFPAFNDAGSIAALVRNALVILPALTDEYEVLVINDGSTDDTAAILRELERDSPNVKVVHHSQNKGYGAALRSGFMHASKDLIFYTDGDGQYDVCELIVLFQLMRDDVDVVNGYKLGRADDLHRKVTGAVYNRAARLLFRVPIRDVDCDFRLLRRSALQRINLTRSSGVICVELVRKLHAAGCVFAEAPVHHYPRLHGRSQFFTVWRVAQTIRDFLAMWLKLIVEPRFARVTRSRRAFGNAEKQILDQEQDSS